MKNALFTFLCFTTLCNTTFAQGLAVSVNSTTTCSGGGGCESLTPIPSGGTAPYNYHWSTGVTSASIYVCPSATESYTVTVTDSSPSAGTVTAIATITVDTWPTFSGLANTTICSGTSAVLTIYGANSYTWAPESSLSATTGSTVTASPTSTKTYTVIGTTINNCTSSASVIVTVNPAPVIAAFAQSASIC